MEIVGFMGYEAQISGLQNINPFEPKLLNKAIQTFQVNSFSFLF